MLNQCTPTGNLGADPEVFYSPEGNPVSSFSLAFHSSKKKTGWIKVVCFQKLAEVSAKYLHKGARIAVIGTLDHHRWETDEGIQKSSFQLIANSLEFIKTDGRGEERLGELDDGKVEDVIDVIKRLSSLPRCDQETSQREIGYFEKSKERMRYADFRRRGLFVGSGVLEAGCRTVIGQRLKQSGMHWAVRGANSIIALRCSLLSNRWEDFWEHWACAWRFYPQICRTPGDDGSL